MSKPQSYDTNIEVPGDTVLAGWEYIWGSRDTQFMMMMRFMEQLKE